MSTKGRHIPDEQFPFKGNGLTFGRDAKGNPQVVIPKGSPLSALDPFLKAGLVKDIYIQTRFPRQAFFVSSETWAAMTEEDVKATYTDMLELGIANPPYPDFDIIFKAKDIFSRNKIADLLTPTQRHDWEDADALFRYHDGMLIDAQFNWNCKGSEWNSLFDRSGSPFVEGYEIFVKNIREQSKFYLAILVVLLGTRNVIKSVATNKLAKLGIGKNKQRHWYTTTLKIGTITETVATKPSEPTGRTVRPHLRRGHRRKQRFGPKREFYKFIWVEPTFVNADEDFVSTRTGYNVSKTNG